jgi:hypothetical protein
VVLLDEFDHFGQTLGNINVSIDDSLTFDRPYEGCRHTSFGDRTPNQNFWLKLANSFVFYSAASVVFSASSVNFAIIGFTTHGKTLFNL